MKKITFFDTTLRDGAQSASAMLQTEDKAEIAMQLEKLNVDVIEAGFPASSKKEAEIIGKIAKKSSKIIAALARSRKEDVEIAWECIRNAKKPRIHIFIASSKSHMENKLHMTKEEVIANAVNAIRYAKEISNGKVEVEFSAEDSTRSEEEFLLMLYEKAIEAGAEIINVPDTVGYAMTQEFSSFIGRIRKRFPKIKISVHCHNDLGLAVANSICAISAGADQVHCTINGVGERAGNASLEEIASIMHVRKNFLNCFSDIKMNEISRTSKMVSKKFGVEVPHYKAIVGKNALSHEAGIHVQYVQGYEIFKPEDIGMQREIVLGKHSGIHTVLEVAKIANVKIGKEHAASILKEVKRGDFKITSADFKKFIDKTKVI
ncbi:MAG: 2-isopropylmalate synthase [archaeon]